MAEVAREEPEMLVDDTNNEKPGKQSSILEKVPNQNGLDSHNGSSHENRAPPNGVSDKVGEESTITDKMETDDGVVEDGPLENGALDKDESNTGAQSLASVKSGDSDALDGRNTASPVVVNSDLSQDADNSSEAIDVDNKDDDSNVIELSSNISAQNSDIVEMSGNNSNHPSVISEESSRDSIESNESSKSGESSESKKAGLVDTVKGDNGDEFMITLNEEDGQKEKSDAARTSEEKDGDNKNKEKVAENSEKSSDSGTLEKGKTGSISEPAEEKLGANTLATSAGTTLLIPISSATGASSSQNILVQGTLPNMRGDVQLVQQGNKVGYVSLVGSQHIFVPVTNASAIPSTVPKTTVVSSQLSAQQAKTQPSPAVAPENLRPKSSWEMIELMRWELQNRVPDNYNWCVAFHPRREELSSITHFLQELGSDVVKEQVYKDIIQIQTKKKEEGVLKNPEVESLEKMKTVYENTKKKVEHLQVDTKRCSHCDYKTESDVVMNYHLDYPHYDPPWDTNKGVLQCARCDFKTKTPMQYILHQKDMHNVNAKFKDKPQYFHCSLCPLSVSTKSKLEKHQQKCVKNFKLNGNLQPYYHDVNFCMKTCYYRPKKVVPKPQPPQPKAVQAKPAVASVATRQGIVPAAQQVLQQPQTAVRHQLISSAAVARQNALRLQQAQQAQARPRLGPPPLQRAPIQVPQKPVNKEMSGFEVCELCGGYVKDRQALRIHFYYAHKVEMPQAVFRRPSPPLTCDVCKQNYWTTQGLTKHKTATRHFSQTQNKPSPSSVARIINQEQECFMCLKKFPNLFVHFEKVHGMTMKDLVLVRKCIMCGLAAADYKALEAHLMNSHGVMIRINDYLSDRNKIIRPQVSNSPQVSGGKNVGKINYCVFCQIQFADNIQLTMHCIKTHAACKTCGMVVATSKHLEFHSCNKAHINRSCDVCGEKLPSEKYAAHLRSHVKSCEVKVENLTEDQIDMAKNKIKREYKPAVISLDSDEDSDVEVVETKPGDMKVPLESENDVEMVDLSEDSNESSEKQVNLESVETGIKKAEKAETDKNVDGEDNSENKDENTADDNKSEGVLNESKESNSESKNTVNDEKQESVAGTTRESEAKNEADSNNKSEKEHSMNDSENKEEKLDNESSSESKEKLLTEEEIDEKLLENDNDSVTSSESRKRKKSESDIDEDDLLRDDTTEMKRAKTEEGAGDAAVIDKNGDGEIEGC